MRRLKKCGTHAAYLRHRANGEKPCDECAKAHNEYVNQRRNANGSNRARQRAMTRLAKAHPEEFQRLMTEELAKEALKEAAGGEQPC